MATSDPGRPPPPRPGAAPGPGAPPPSIASRAAHGAAWIGAAEAVRTGLGLLVAFLGPFLLSAPAYGTVAAVLVLLGGLEALSQAGFRQALVQRPTAEPEVLDTGWTLLVLRGLLLTAILLAAAPRLAAFFPDAEGDLVAMLRAVAWVPALAGLGSPGVFLLTRELAFKRLLAVVALPALIQAVVAVVLLLRDATPWAFVWARLALAGSELVVSYLVAPHLPRPRLVLRHALELARFGRWIFGLSALGFVLTQVDNLVVGGVLGVAALGVYRTAYDLSRLPVARFAWVLHKAAMPAYARVQRDRTLAAALHRRLLRGAALTALPSAAAIAVFVPDVVALFRPGFEDVVPVTRLLCLSVPPVLFAAAAAPLFQGLGRPSLAFAVNLVRAGLLVGGLVLLRDHLTLTRLCALVFLAAVAPYWIWKVGLRDLVGLRPRDAWFATGPGWLVAGAYGLPAWGLRAVLPEGPAAATAAALLALVGALGLLRALAARGGWDFFAELRSIRQAVRRGGEP